MTTQAPGTNRRSKVVVLAATVALMLSLLPFASVLAAATVTPATGGSAISADAAPGGGGPAVTLVGPVVTEALAGDLVAGQSIVLSMPTFDFVAGSGGVSVGGAGCAGLVVDFVGTTTSIATLDILSASTSPCVVTFSGLQVRPAVGSPLGAGDISNIGGTGPGGNWGSLTGVPGAPVLSFAAPGQEPSASSTGGIDLAQQPIVRARDQFGNPRVAGDVVTLAFQAGTNTEGATLTCTQNPVSTVGASAVATFAGCDIDKAGTYNLTASTPSGTPANSVQITISVGAATKLGFTSYPASRTTTTLAPQPVVAIQDAGGNTVTGASATIALSSNAGSLACTGGNSKPTTLGVAAFSGCTLTPIGNGYTLSANDGGALTDITGAAFNVTSGVATRLAFTTQPTAAVVGGTTSGTAGVAWTTQPVVTIRDTSSVTVTSDNTTVVTLTIEPLTPTTGGPGTLTCSGGQSKTAVLGVATFSGCTIDKPGTAYKLRATSSPSLALATSNPFSIIAGPATKLGFTAQPGASTGSTAFAIQPVVAIQDAGGNTVTTASAKTITLAIGTNPGGGTLTCTGGLSKVTVSGVATFSGCQINNAGVGYTITADDGIGGFAAITSSAFNVTAPTATLTLSSDLSITTYRQFINLGAQFSGTGGANRLVTFQRMTALLPATWVTIGTATSNAAGRASFTYGPPYNTQFRAVFAGAADLAAVTSNTITVNVRHKVTLRPGAGTTTFVRPGTRITYTATVRPIAPAGLQRVTFLIYKRVSGVWTFRTSATVPTVAGVASFSWRWSSGEWYMRARGNATIYNLAALSALSKVTAR